MGDGVSANDVCLCIGFQNDSKVPYDPRPTSDLRRPSFVSPILLADSPGLEFAGLFIRSVQHLRQGSHMIPHHTANGKRLPRERLRACSILDRGNYTCCASDSMLQAIYNPALALRMAVQRLLISCESIRHTLYVSLPAFSSPITHQTQPK